MPIAPLPMQGVLIGNRESVGFLEIADEMYAVRDWRRYGGSAADSPIHSEHLTAMYFPGALRDAQHRRDAVSRAVAAAAIRSGLHGLEPGSADEGIGADGEGAR